MQHSTVDCGDGLHNSVNTAEENPLNCTLFILQTHGTANEFHLRKTFKKKQANLTLLPLGKGGEGVLCIQLAALGALGPPARTPSFTSGTAVRALPRRLFQRHGPHL